jgi:hypothetical protein
MFRLTERCSDQSIETSRRRQFAKSRRLPNAPASPAQFAVTAGSIGGMVVMRRRSCHDGDRVDHLTWPKPEAYIAQNRTN